ncbi:hypothetical protein PAHAL_4G015900 [Panicum hallii]|uniref:Uncharacterized protein n=1 Tax=Panicum hallii TaxID=206008 RepID=A0A2T8JBH8_9POAL|nr:hypothetical protein PAHAL_4G015900 [Panicum hallii]
MLHQLLMCQLSVSGQCVPAGSEQAMSTPNYFWCGRTSIARLSAGRRGFSPAWRNHQRDRRRYTIYVFLREWKPLLL